MASNGMKIAIVGGGLAGLAAAMKIAEAGHAVDLFSVVPVKRSHSVCAQGGINGAVNTKGEGDSTWEHFDDTVYGGDFLTDDVERLQHEAFGVASSNWTVRTEFHFGGFAKRRGELDAFIDDFEARHGLRLDWVYVAKMMYGVFALIEQGVFPRGARIGMDLMRLRSACWL